MMKSLKLHKGFPHEWFIYTWGKVALVVVCVSVKERERDWEAESFIVCIFFRVESIEADFFQASSQWDKLELVFQWCMYVWVCVLGIESGWSEISFHYEVVSLNLSDFL